MSRINTNVSSLVATRILSKNNESLNQALQRLSTGLRINTAKDDPAGLIGSERLRAETTALSAAIDNANRADNLVSVAEGGLQEVSSLLTQLEGLVDHASNTAGLSSDELAANQLQVDTILDTINRISTSTEFSGKKLLNGSLDYTTSSMPASGINDLKINSARLAPNSTKTVVVAITAIASAARLRYTNAGSVTSANTKTIQITGKYGTEQFTFKSSTTFANIVTAVNAVKTLTGVSATTAGTNLDFNSTDFGLDAFVSVEAIQNTFAVTDSAGAAAVKDVGKDVSATINGVQAITKGLDISLRSTALSLDTTLSQSFATTAAATRTFYVKGGGANFSIAPTQGLNALASIGIQNTSTSSLGTKALGYLSTLGSGQANQVSAGTFETAQRIIRAASAQVSSLRGRLGAFQKNTLASTVNSLQVSYENVTAAESAIRDADFATETSRLTRSQILVQSATSVLQQANSAPQNVLTLLR